MLAFVFEAPPVVSLPVTGTERHFPIRRVFCVGRNYAAHAAEMGSQVDHEAPWYFLKSAHAVAQSGQTLPMALETENYHHEVELVAALGADAFRVSRDKAMEAVFGFACGLDMTRRDLQAVAKEKRRPWDIGKDIENGAVIAPITEKSNWTADAAKGIELKVNGTVRQSATLGEMIWDVPAIICHLSRFYHLQAGDVIMTGTPAGVGPVNVGDTINARIDGLKALEMKVSDAP